MLKLILLTLTLTIALSQKTPRIICSQTPTVNAIEGATPLSAGTTMWAYDCTQKVCKQTTSSGSVVNTQNWFKTQADCEATCPAGIQCRDPTVNLDPVVTCNTPGIKGRRVILATCAGPRDGYSYDPATATCSPLHVDCLDKISANFFMTENACMAFCKGIKPTLSTATTMTMDTSMIMNMPMASAATTTTTTPQQIMAPQQQKEIMIS